MSQYIDPALRQALGEIMDLENQIQDQMATQKPSINPFQEDTRDIVNIFIKDPTKRKSLEERGKIMKTQFEKEKGERLRPLEGIRATADNFQRGNQELKARVLVLLREYIKPGDSPEEILKKVREFYEDVSLADEALDYLLETTDGELYNSVLKAKEMLNQEFGREVKAGRNIGDIARSTQGIGTPTNLRDLYRDITINPRESTTLFNELNKNYAYNDLQKVIDFLLHSVGADLKSKGPSIPRGLLHNLLQETRTLQAILGVYNFFKDRMGLIQKQLFANDIPLPPELTFEQLAKQFMLLVSDRYPSQDKVLQTAGRLGIEKWILAKIIVLSQLRDSIREVSINQIYRSLQHRDELFTAIIAALEQLEDELEELLEKQQREQEGEEGDAEEQEDESFDEDEEF